MEGHPVVIFLDAALLFLPSFERALNGVTGFYFEGQVVFFVSKGFIEAFSGEQFVVDTFFVLPLYAVGVCGALWV